MTIEYRDMKISLPDDLPVLTGEKYPIPKGSREFVPKVDYHQTGNHQFTKFSEQLE